MADDSTLPTGNPPPDGTVERWAWAYVVATDLATKVAPPPPPADWEQEAPPRRLDAPGRPAALVVVERGRKTPKDLRDPRLRAELLHTFLHHELQAAELMCWAILAFPEAPGALKRGLLGVALDELRHMRMYGEHMASLGLAFGDLPVNDWFWERVPQSETAAHFVAGMGMGFEGGNLDHAARFAVRFREAGDAEGAALQAAVAEEEIPHVKLATHWFRALTGRSDFDAWRRYLPVPLTPMIMRGRPINVAARTRAGFDDAFLRELGRWKLPGS